MKPETQAFLARVHGADTPSVEDEERVLRALRVSVAMGASASVAVASPASGWWSSSLGAGARLVAIAGCVALAATDTPNGVVEVARREVLAGISAAATSPVPSTTALSPAVASTAVPFLAVSSTAVAPTAAPWVPSTVAAQKAGSVRATASSRAAPAPAEAPAGEPSAVSAASLSAELALLRVVQSALKRGDGASALSALDAHETLDRQFLAERAAARILALCAVGRVIEARGAAARFADAHPSSVHHATIARSCANSKRIDTP